MSSGCSRSILLTTDKYSGKRLHSFSHNATPKVSLATVDSRQKVSEPFIGYDIDQTQKHFQLPSYINVSKGDSTLVIRSLQ